MAEHDEVVRRAIESLRELPEVRADAKARLLISVAAERQRTREAERRSPRRQVWAALAAVAAIVVAAALLPRVPRGSGDASVAMSSVPTRVVPALQTASASDLSNAPRPVQLVFSAPQAKSVRVVGDFNGWDERQSPMVRDEVSGLWNVNLLLRPGRHVYAFVVNDTQWVRDPRATAAPDADFGRPGSVVLVGRQ